MLVRSIRRAFAPVNLVTTAAVALSLAGVSVAAIGSFGITNNSIRGIDIRNGTIASLDVRNGSLTGLDIKGDSVYGADVRESSLGAVPQLAGHTSFKQLDVPAFTAGDEATGRAGAPLTTLLTVGDLKLQAACFRSTAADIVYGEVYMTTAVDGAMFASTLDALRGGPTFATSYLLAASPLVDRQVLTAQAADDNTALEGGSQGEGDFTALDVQGRWMSDTTSIVIRNGLPAGGFGAAGALDFGCGFFGVADHSA